MIDSGLQAIIEQVKVDVLTPTQVADNEKQLEQVSRNFVSEFISYLSRTCSHHDKLIQSQVGKVGISCMEMYAQTTACPVPTKAMYEYAVRASIGDAVFHDPCTSALEEHMAQLTGKEAALFVSSGTLSNQLAIRTHLHQPPFSIITDVRSHINEFAAPPRPRNHADIYYRYEAGGAAMHSGAYPIPVTPSNGLSPSNFSLILY